jgi:hypothetical protein
VSLPAAGFQQRDASAIGCRFGSAIFIGQAFLIIGTSIRIKATIDSGTYYSDNRSMWQMGSLALSHPSGTSPFDPTVDNYIFALEVAEYPEQPQIPWHFAGGWFDQDTGLPTVLIFTEDRLWFELLKYNEPPHYPIRVDYETEAVDCGNSFPDVTFASHMSQISVPVFLVGAIGGFGHSSDYNTSLTRSKDVQILIVQALSNGMQASDYGHVDLLTARDANTRGMATNPGLDCRPSILPSQRRADQSRPDVGRL